MKHIRNYMVLAGALMLLPGCQDLSVENENNPTREVVLAAPEDVQNLIAGAFEEYWSSMQWNFATQGWSAMADEWSASWGNWGMRDNSEEPRKAFNNDPAYSYRAMLKSPWDAAYRCISNASEGLAFVKADPQSYTDAGLDVVKLEAFANFVIGICHGNLAVRFDRAFTLDEATNLEAVADGSEPLVLRPYTEVRDFAIEKLDKAISLSQGASFVIEDDWIFGLSIPASDFVGLANSFVARFLVTVPRDGTERDAVTWSEVVSRVDNGYQAGRGPGQIAPCGTGSAAVGIVQGNAEFAPCGDDDGDIEWDNYKWYGHDSNTWSRADYRTIGPADESAGYAGWVAASANDRDIYDGYTTSDRRLEGATPGSDGLYFEYHGRRGPFPSNRGTWHYSSHTITRFLGDYRSNGANGPMVHMSSAEMRLYKAEALLRTGNAPGAADLINVTRVGNGELPPATGSDGIGTPADGDWHNTGQHLAGASLWAKLSHEFRIETYATSGALAWAYKRGLEHLYEGTPTQMPVPGQELEVLDLLNYTFGAGNTFAAAKRANRRVGPQYQGQRVQ